MIMIGRILALLLLLAAERAWAELWTNQAAKVIQGNLEHFDGATVTLARTNGATLTLPLSAFCAADQRRVLAWSRRSVAPEFVWSAYRDAAAALARFDRLPADQQTAEARGKAANMARSVFDARVQPRSAELASPAVLQEVSRIRGLLQ